MATAIAETAQAFSGVIKFADASVDQFQRAMLGVSKRLEDELQDIMAAFTVENGRFVGDKRTVARLSKLQADVNRALKKSGYPQATETFIGRYPKLGKQVQGAWKKATGVHLPFTTADTGALRAVTGAQFEAFANIGTQGAAQLTDMLTRAVVGDGSWSAMTNQLKLVVAGTGRRDKLGRGMFRHAETLADTAMAQTNRVMDGMQGKAAGIKRWVYNGPTDKVVRPFCERLMKQVADDATWTRKAIDGLDNSRAEGGAGAGKGSAFTQAGGWNCRHRWLPVVEEERAAA